MTIRTFSFLVCGVAQLSLFAAGANAAPQGLLPNDGNIQVLTSRDTGHIDFAWTKVPGAVRYRLAIAKNSGLTGARTYSVSDTTVRAWYRDHWKTWDWGTTYYWKVSAVLPDSSLEESGLSSFAIPPYDGQDAPGIFAKSGQTGVPPILGLEYNLWGFSWARLEVATDSGFTNIVDSGWMKHPPGPNSGSGFRTVELEPLKSYYVRSFAGEFPDGPSGGFARITGPSRVIGPFTTSTHLHTPITYLSPQEGGKVDFDSAAFSYVPPRGADLVTLELSSDNFSGGTIYSYTKTMSPAYPSTAVFGFAQGMERDSIIVRGRPGAATEYQWRFRTTFRGQSVDLGPVRTVSHLYDSAGRPLSFPTALEPIPRDTLVIPGLESGHVRFKWTKPVAALDYRLFLSTGDPSFAQSQVFPASDTVLKVAMRGGLKSWDWGKTYYWKVEARYKNGSFGESPAYSFSIPAYDSRAPILNFNLEDGKVPVSLTLDYQPKSLQRHYLEVALDTGFSNLVLASWQPDPTSGPVGARAWPSFTLKHSTVYYARMFGRDADSLSPHRTGPSARIRFKTMAPTGDPITILHPDDGGLVTFDTQIPFSFVKPRDGSRLVLEFSEDDFSSAPIAEHPVDYSFHSLEDPAWPDSDRNRIDFYLGSWSFASNSVRWRVRTTHAGKTLALSPSRLLKLDSVITGGDNAPTFIPTLVYPESGVLLGPASNAFYWTIQGQSNVMESYHFRIVEAAPPFGVFKDTVLVQSGQYGSYFFLLDKPLPPGKRYRWSVRAGAGTRFGEFAAPREFESLIDLPATDLCRQMNGIGNTKAWRYNYTRVMEYEDSRTSNAPDTYDSSTLTLQFQADDVVRTGDALQYKLTSRIGPADPATDEFRHAGCAVSRFDREKGIWAEDSPMDSEWWMNPRYGIERNLKSHFLLDSLVLRANRTYAWKRYRDKIYLEVTVRIGKISLPPGAINSIYGDFRGTATYLEGIGLLSWRFSQEYFSRWVTQRDKDSWDLTQFDDQPFDRAQYSSVPQSEVPRPSRLADAPPRERRRTSMSLSLLRQEKDWLRADLYDVTGTRRARFLPQGPMDERSIPDGLYLLRVEYRKGPRTFLLAR